MVHDYVEQISKLLVEHDELPHINAIYYKLKDMDSKLKSIESRARSNQTDIRDTKSTLGPVDRRAEEIYERVAKCAEESTAQEILEKIDECLESLTERFDLLDDNFDSLAEKLQRVDDRLIMHFNALRDMLMGLTNRVNDLPPAQPQPQVNNYHISPSTAPPLPTSRRR